MENSKFENFIVSIKDTLESYEFEKLSPRLKTIFKGAKKALNDKEIMDAFKILYDDHLFVREACHVIFKVALQLLKMDCL